jgi:hypothetical protein
MEEKPMELITRKEAMIITKYCRSHWQRLVKQGKAPMPINQVGNNLLYDKEEVTLFAQAMGRLTKPDL